MRIFRTFWTTPNHSLKAILKPHQTSNERSTLRPFRSALNEALFTKRCQLQRIPQRLVWTKCWGHLLTHWGIGCLANSPLTVLTMGQWCGIHIVGGCFTSPNGPNALLSIGQWWTTTSTLDMHREQLLFITTINKPFQYWLIVNHNCYSDLLSISNH